MPVSPICNLAYVAAFIFVASCTLAAPVTRLTTDYLTNPVGTDSLKPGFSWQMNSVRRGAAQTAYQVQVATSKALLIAGRPNMWDSGKVRSAQSIAVVYAGKPLRSRTAYYWHVRVCDETGAVWEFSKPALFETAILKQSEWSGQWISCATDGGNGYHSQYGASPDDTKWVQIDLGRPTKFSEIVLYPARPYNFQRDVPGFGFPIRYRIDASDNADMQPCRTISDRQADDQPNPGADPVRIAVSEQPARYIRLTAIRLDQPTGTQPELALAEMQILNSKGRNVALGAAVKALDSIEDFGWAATKLTDGQCVSKESVECSPILRHEFDIAKPISRARAYVTGLGYYELRINGSKVGDRVLDPARTEFSKRVCYSTYDVTSMLKHGRNCAGAMLGRGWWNEAPRFLLQLVVDYADGSTQKIITDGSWKWTSGPVLENSLYNGEVFDARKEPMGWDKPGFVDKSWQSASVVKAPDVMLSAQMMQPIRVVETLSPRTITSPKPGVYVVDFGQNVSGWCRIKATAAAGARITMRYAELLYPDGTVNQENLRSARATDVYTTRGEGAETYEPRFTYHGFRYVQVEGYPGELKKDDIRSRLVCTDLAPRGSFACSNDLLNHIQHNAFWGERTNFHSIPTDCPQRDERQGWMGDAWMSSDAMYHNFDMAAAYINFLRDISDDEGADGAVPDTVPHVWGSQPGDPMWSAAYPAILWETYLYTGDKRVLAQYFDGAKRSVDYLGRESQGGIVSRNIYGDWIAVQGTPGDLISTGTYCWLAGLISDIAHALGAPYGDPRSDIAKAFNTRFFDSATGSYGNGSQFSNAFPLYLGIVPQDKKSVVVKNLISDIEKRDNHLSTGFIGTPFMLDALAEQGHADVAYKIVSQDTYPGWGYMVKNGATTTWELWELKTGNGMNSHNHPALGFISSWFYQMLGGLNIDPAHPAWEHFTVKPYVLGDLKWAKASVDTLRGRVASEWRLTDKGIALTVNVPANSSASIYIPKLGKKDCLVREGKYTLWRDGEIVSGTQGIRAGCDQGDWIRFDVTAGQYSFSLTAP